MAKPKKIKAPPGCYWENGVLYWRVKIKVNGIEREKRGSLYTSDPAVAIVEREKKKKELVELYRHSDNGDLMSFVAALEKWLAHLPSAVEPSTATRYICSMQQLKPYLKNISLLQVTRELLWKIVDDRQKSVTNATIKRDMTSLSAMIEYAIKRGWFGERSNPARAVMAGLKEKHKPVNLPHDNDIKLVMSEIKDPFPALMKAALLTGCRLDELVSAQRRDYDPKAKTLHIRKAKWNKSRTIDLKWNDGYKLFDSLPAFAGQPWLFWRHENKRERHDTKVVTLKGDKLESASQRFGVFTRELAKKCKAEKREFIRFKFHDLRHRHAVDFLNSLKPGSGVDIYSLKDRLGHSTVKQTEEYLKVITPDQARIAKYGRAA